MMELQRKRSARMPMCDEKIIELYMARNERAIEETDLKYGKYLRSVAYNVLHDQLDCEECLNDTYIGAWNAIPPAQPRVLRAFLTTIIRRLAVKRYHAVRRKRVVPSEMTVSLSELEDILADDGSPDTELDTERLGRLLSDFVRELSERRQFIFMSRYYASESIDGIASELNVSRSTVNKEIAAIKALLTKKLESEGYSI